MEVKISNYGLKDVFAESGGLPADVLVYQA
jgi:hypothetical protein